LNTQDPGPTSGAAALSPAERRILLEEIGRIALTLGQDSKSAAEAAIPASPASPPQAGNASPLERLHLLAALWQEMLSPLSALLHRPDSRLESETVSVPLPCAQGGPDLTQRIARTPGGQAAWREMQASRQGEASALPTHMVAESRPRTTVATTANRFVASLLLAVAEEATALARLAAFCGEIQAAEQITEVASAAERWRRHPTLRGLTPLTAAEWQTLSGVNTLRAAPPYRALFTIWRKLHAALHFDWSGAPLLFLPPLEPWNLYEVWCFLHVAETLRTADWRCVGGEAIRREARGLRLVLAKGQASRLVFVPTQAAQRRRRGMETLELFYQPLFLSANRRGVSRLAPNAAPAPEDPEAGFVSLTHAMQPDIGLSWQKRWYLLDPKFRTYAEWGAEQEDVDKMHAYRDAIVRSGGLQRVVAAAWCLFPGEPAREPISLETAVRAYPLATVERPFGAAGIGALRLRPGDPGSTAWMVRLLASWLL